MKLHITNLICFLKGHDWKYVYRRRLNRRTWEWYTVIDHCYCVRCSHSDTHLWEISFTTLPEICRSIVERLRSYIHKNNDTDIPF